MRPIKIKKRHRKIIYTILFFKGLGLMIWGIKIFRNTIIDIKIPLVIILLTSLISFLIDYKNFKKTYEKKGTGGLFYGILQYIISYGFIACSLFILINYYYAQENTDQRVYQIKKRSSLPGGKYRRNERKPTFIINFEGKEKELVFQHKYYLQRNQYNSVEMKVKKGYFGFDILFDKKLIK